ncbi:hypothetical protein HDU93_005448, partial [Gonapodya sp. JEL0774]
MSAFEQAQLELKKKDEVWKSNFRNALVANYVRTSLLEERLSRLESNVDPHSQLINVADAKELELAQKAALDKTPDWVKSGANVLLEHA